MLRHGHEDCEYFRLPKSNVEFWKAKIERNVARDVCNEVALKALGWRVVRVWECELRNKVNREETLNRIYDSITSYGTNGYSFEETDISTAAEPESDYSI